jgi:tripartite ATP-independent transporter DctM subunit
VNELAAALMFPALFALIFLGVPVAFGLVVVAFFFGLGVFGANIGLQFHLKFTEIASNYVLTAVPLFVFMGSVLERSGIAERLFAVTRLWMGGMPGGLALATIVMCAIFAASTGIVGAVETMVGMMAIPPMLRNRYHRGLIAGTICAGGSLGTIIPPSIVVVIYCSIARVSVGDMLAGIMIPGVGMAALFFLYIAARCLLRPEDGPPASREELAMRLAEKLRLTLSAIVPAVLLILAVLGTILWGVASPTEAAAVGCVGAVALTFAYGRFSGALLSEVLKTTLRITSMIMLIVLGGTLFAGIFLLNGGDGLVRGAVEAWRLTPAELIAILLIIVFILGFILDWVSIVLICIPIYVPILAAVGIDALWFGVMVCVVIQTSYLTPPMAPAIFYLRAVAPPEISYPDMFRGVVPFIVLQLGILALVALYPPTATWLPTVVFGD